MEQVLWSCPFIALTAVYNIYGRIYAPVNVMKHP